MDLCQCECLKMRLKKTLKTNPPNYTSIDPKQLRRYDEKIVALFFQHSSVNALWLPTPTPRPRHAQLSRRERVHTSFVSKSKPHSKFTVWGKVGNENCEDVTY